MTDLQFSELILARAGALSASVKSGKPLLVTRHAKHLMVLTEQFNRKLSHPDEAQYHEMDFEIVDKKG